MPERAYSHSTSRVRYRLAGGLAGAGVEAGGAACDGGVAIGPAPVAPEPVVVRGAVLVVAVGVLFMFEAVSVLPPQ